MITKQIRPDTTEADFLNSAQRFDAPPQLNPFAMAARESVTHKQTEML
jgi:hypothetical protein